VLEINIKKEYLLLAVIAIVTLTLALCSDFFRILLGLPYLLFVPGYLIMAAIYPKNDSIDSLARLSLSVGLSIIIVPIIGLIHNYLSWGINLLSLLISLFFINSILLLIGFFRRKNLPEEERFILKMEINLKPEVIYISLFIISIILIISSLFILYLPANTISFTEFYITGSDGIAANFPEQLKAMCNFNNRSGWFINAFRTSMKEYNLKIC
jgi:uncharacterized membrane protein